MRGDKTKYNILFYSRFALRRLRITTRWVRYVRHECGVQQSNNEKYYFSLHNKRIGNTFEQ